MEEVSCESTTKAREDLDLVPGKNISSVRQDECLLSAQKQTVCAECEKTFATEEEHRRHMNHEHTSKTDNVTLEEANLQIETKIEENNSNNSNKEQVDASHDFRCRNCEEVEKRSTEEKLKLEQELANTQEKYEKVKVESELNKKALIKIEEIVLNKTKEKKTPKRELEDDIEAQVIKEAVVTIQEDENEGLQQLLENKSRGYRRTSPSDKSVRHEENANAPPIQESHEKPTDKSSKTT